MNSKTYWEKREAEALKIYIKDEAEYSKELDRIYADMLDNIQKEIDSFYQKYASAEGITLAEAKKRVSKLEIEKYERKAKKYVKEAALDRKANGGKTNFKGSYFSEKANAEMRLYNATMKINRLEMLKANIGLETIKGHAELESFMDGILQGRTMEELERQAGILGKTVQNNAKMANAIVNGSFKVDKVGERTTFSDRIWQYHDEMKNELSRLLSTGLIQGKNSRAIMKDLKKYWYGKDPKTNGGARYCMERLMRTELARVQTEAQKQSFISNGFEMYTFHANHGCCSICSGLDGKHFKVAKMMPGDNAPPMHPHCRCSTSAYEDSEEYEAWLDHLANGGTTEEWNAKTGKAVAKPKATQKKDKATKPKTDAKQTAGGLDVASFPEAFRKGAEKKNTQKFVDYVNGVKGANPVTIKLYNSMNKLESIASNGFPFKITHGKNHAVRYTQRISGDLVEAQLVIPKLSGENLAGQINTTLHECMHLLDMHCRTNVKKGGGWYSSSKDKLRNVFSNTSADMSDEVATLFKAFNAEHKATCNAVYEEYKQKRDDLKKSYFPNGESPWSDIEKYRQYEKEAKKLEKWLDEERDYRGRNIMGGGVNALQDIYDALSGGGFRDNGTVTFGHGSRYYVSRSSRVEETLANYGALSVLRPDLVEMLRKDKPELVSELEATVEEMLRMAGE